MTIYLSLLICLIGLVVYAFASGGEHSSPRVAAIAKDCFWVGLLAFLLEYHKVFNL